MNHMSRLREWFDKAVKDDEISSTDYTEFKEQRLIGTGGFGDINLAKWERPGGEATIQVALKGLRGNDDLEERTFKQFVNEFRHLQRANHQNIVEFLGVTKDTSIGKYLLILKYAEDGNLQIYLKNNFNALTWSDKLRMAREIASGLECLHGLGIIHRDLHSKNILVHHGRMLIADLGLARNDTSFQSMNECGLIAYCEPNIYLLGPTIQVTSSSDIYSYGVLLWEISANRRPALSVMDIIAGKRETVIAGTPQDYENLYKVCWVTNQDSRPTISEIVERLTVLDFSNY